MKECRENEVASYDQTDLDRHFEIFAEVCIITTKTIFGENSQKGITKPWEL